MNDLEPITCDAALEVAHRIARRLAMNALWSGDACTWMILANGSAGRETLSSQQEVAGEHLYRGTAGIGMFLAECTRLTGDRELHKTAAGAFRHASRIATFRQRGKFGFYVGDAGLAYTLHRYERCSNNAEFAEQSQQLLTVFSGSAETDIVLDIMSGTAGTLLAALSLREAFGTVALDIASRCGGYLLSRSMRGANGWSWAPSKKARETLRVWHMVPRASRRHCSSSRSRRMKSRIYSPLSKASLTSESSEQETIGLIYGTWQHSTIRNGCLLLLKRRDWKRPLHRRTSPRRRSRGATVHPVLP